MIEFGTEVTISDKLVRDFKEGYYFWKSKPIDEQLALFLGTRTLTNGTMTEIVHGEFDEEYDSYYSPDETITVALVVTGPRTNPFYCTLGKLK